MKYFFNIYNISYMSLIDAINTYIQVRRDVNSHDETGNTFLHYAILENNLVAIDLLLQNGAILMLKIVMVYHHF